MAVVAATAAGAGGSNGRRSMPQCAPTAGTVAPSGPSNEPASRGGRVRVQGEEWSAQTGDPDQVCPTGVSVLIVDIRGATAMVQPLG